MSNSITYREQPLQRQVSLSRNTQWDVPGTSTVQKDTKNTATNNDLKRQDKSKTNDSKDFGQKVPQQIIDIRQQQDRYKKIGSGGFGSVYQSDANTVYKVVQMSEIQEKDPELMAKVLKQQKANIRCILNEIDIYKYLQQRQYSHMLIPLSYIQNTQLTGILLERAHINLLDYFNMLQLDNSLPNYELKVSLFLHIIRELILSIQDLHHTGVVHCDIKPNNIMLKFDQTGRIKLFLIDFGLSYIINEPLPGIQGTETYIDPQFIWTGIPTPWCDIWSICSLILQLFAEDTDFRVLQISCLKKMKEIANYQQVLQKVINNRINQIKQPDILKILKLIMKVPVDERLDLKTILLLINQQIKEQSTRYKNTSIVCLPKIPSNISSKQRTNSSKQTNKQGQMQTNQSGIPFIQRVFKQYDFTGIQVPVFKYYKQERQLDYNTTLVIYMISDNIVIKQDIKEPKLQIGTSNHKDTNIQVQISQNNLDQLSNNVTKSNNGQRSKDRHLIERRPNLLGQMISLSPIDNTKQRVKGIYSLYPNQTISLSIMNQKAIKREVSLQQQTNYKNKENHNILVSNLKGDIYFNNAEFLTSYRDTLKQYHLQYLKNKQSLNTAFKFKQTHMSFWNCLKIKKHEIDSSSTSFLIVLEYMNSQVYCNLDSSIQQENARSNTIFLAFNQKSKRHTLIRFLDIQSVYPQLNDKLNNEQVIFDTISKSNVVFTTYVQQKLITSSVNLLYNQQIYHQIIQLTQFAIQYIHKNQSRFGSFNSNNIGNPP